MRMLFFGDSVCNGQFVSINKTFPCLLANERKDWIVAVSARNGETSREALERIQHDVLKHPPDVLYVQFGINDANKWLDGMGIERVTLPAFDGNMREIISRARVAGIKYILVGTNHPIGKEYSQALDSPFTFEQNNRLYNITIHDLAADLHCTVVDHHAAWGDFMHDRVLDDGVHLSEEGHGAYFDLLRRYL